MGEEMVGFGCNPFGTCLVEILQDMRDMQMLSVQSTVREGISHRVAKE
jgi:hypothetical protein